MIILTPFEERDFARLIAWVDSPELMVTIAGYEWTYPLTSKQLQAYLNNPQSHSFNIVHQDQPEPIGHAEVMLYEDGIAKIDKLIIGDQAYRGKGLCVPILEALITYAFSQLDVKLLELNVFDWNQGAIRCYEKAGFQFNPAKQQSFAMDDKTWIALNMFIEEPNH